MDRERWPEVDRLFHRALELPAERRQKFLAGVADPDLQAEVASLLEHDCPEFMSERGALPVVGEDAGETEIGSYTLEGELGRGGMGVVYRARDRRLDRPVAIKFLLNPLLETEEALVRLEREARILAQFNHPNIATIYSLETTADDRRFIVLELVEGVTLAEHLHEHRVSLGEALAICRQVARALHVAHSRSVVHRDLKPENVIIDPEGTVKVLDFGLAHVLKTPVPDTSRHASPGSRADPDSDRRRVRGTPGYVSPESLLGGDVDHRTDLFAFGCLLYECLAGRRAFTGTTTADICQATLSSEPDFSALPAETPPSVRALLTRCLEKDPARRLGDVGDAAKVLVEWRDTPPSPVAIALSEVPNNLPAPASSFVGRVRELACVRSLQEQTRLLTFTGPGGCGKTRLACELAREIAPRHAAGAWFADLTSISEPDQVPRAVLVALGRPEKSAHSIPETIIEELGAKPTLVLLDNCEHVRIACARLVELLLVRCPGIAFLTTSREPLGLAGETCYSVPPLSLEARPDARSDAKSEAQAEAQAEAQSEAQAGTGASLMPSSEAIDLWCERARAARPGFRLDVSTAAQVAEICRRVEGIPLAIELVAARVRVMAPGEILSRLDRRMDLITRGGATSVTRHQTLRATFDWSYNLLSDEEKILLRRLSVFSGGFSLDLAEKIASDPRVVVERDVLGLLTALVEKSLVLHQLTPRSEGRYRLLETQRQYAAAELESGGETSAVRDRHLEGYAVLAEEASPQLFGTRQTMWLDRLQEEHENLHAALGWAEECADKHEIALRICTALRPYWHLKAHFGLGREWLQRILDHPDRADSPAALQALYAAASLAFEQDDYVAARAYLEERHGIMLDLGNRPTGGDLRLLGLIADREGDRDRARTLFEESCAAFQNAGDREAVLVVRMDLGNLAGTEGDYETARSIFQELAEAGEEISDVNRSVALGNCASMRCYIGEFEDALDCANQALELASRIGTPGPRVLAQIQAGRASRGLGRLDGAETLLRSALADAVEIGVPILQADAIEILTDVLLDGPAPAWRELETLHRQGMSAVEAGRLGDAGIVSLTLGARISLGHGDPESAVARSTRAVSMLEARHHFDGAEEEVYHAHAQCLAAVGRAEESRRFRVQAAQALTAKADRFRDPELRSLFLATNPVQRAIGRMA